LGTFKQTYIFYLERKDELTGEGPLLKYGKKGKQINHIVDLGTSESLTSKLVIVRHATSKRKFQIITEDVKLSLKAETPEEREAWITDLTRETSDSIQHTIINIGDMNSQMEDQHI
jgi:hypothetical protein